MSTDLTRYREDPRAFAALGVAGSAMLLLGALTFQYVGELAPCALCIWQRWPHGIAIIIGLGAVALGCLGRSGAALLIAATLTELVGAAIAVYHAGVERGVFEGPDTCTSNGVEGLSVDDLMSQIMSAPLVRCDEIVWKFFGLSMAGWNALISLGLAACFAAALFVARRSQASSSASQ